MAVGVLSEQEMDRESCEAKVDVSATEDICTRTSWVDATIAISHINKGRAKGNRAALWVRKCLQDQFYHLGEFSECHAGKIVFVALLIIATFCVALKSATVVTDIEKLWIEGGGRLERELTYVSDTLGEGAGSTNQILIQTPETEGADILTTRSLEAHLHVLLAATKVSVDMFDISWNLNDLCYATSFPYFHNHLIDQIFERLTPCAIITPLDCFWEGSKLLGPDFPVTIPGYGERVKWTNLNPQKLLRKIEQIENSGNFFPFSAFNDFMKRSGISTAYQQKPCLNPMDPDCPDIAPNKHSKKAPDVGAELTGGCYGFAGKYLHCPEELIVGGAKKNRTGHIVRGEALQSIVQLMGAKDLFDHWRDHYKVHNMDWTKHNARLILDEWVNKFSQRVEELSVDPTRDDLRPFRLHPFSSNALATVIEAFSTVPVTRLVISCILMCLYVCVAFFRSSNSQESSSGLALAGLTLVMGSVASGLGLCTLLGLPLSAASTQVLPFLALGMGVDPIFMMLSTIDEIPHLIGAHKLLESESSRVGEVLKRCGASIAVTSLCKATAFSAAAVIPVVAVKVFCLQAAIVVLLTAAAVLLVFPAFISLDMRRKDAARADVLCCFPVTLFKGDSGPEEDCSSWSVAPVVQKVAVTRALSPPSHATFTQVLCEPSSPQECWVGDKPHHPMNTPVDLPEEMDHEGVPSDPTPSKFLSFSSFSQWSLSSWLKNTYAKCLCSGGVRAVVVLCLLFSVAASSWGVSRLEDGLDLTDIVPSGSSAFGFLEAQQKYFGFYNMFAVTQGNFEYPTKQKLLHEYHEAFNRIPWIIKNDDGGLPDSWLVLFRDWLIGLQRSFDSDWDQGLVTEEGWSVNASDRAVLAYKLLVQTGHVDHPVDRSLVSQIRLVDTEGIINAKAFYNYLSAWVTNDALAYSASQADLRPMPRFWVHEKSDYDLKIPKSAHLIYAQFPFYLNRLDDTRSIKEMIQAVRDVCLKFEERGLPNFPSGVPFTYWEQYIHLRFFLVLALAVVLTSVFLILSIVFMNVWASSMVVLMLSTLVLQLAGTLGLLGLKLSAIPAVLLVAAIGIGAEFCVHVTTGFLTAVGDRRSRSQAAVSSFVLVAGHMAASTLLATSPLLLSDYQFVRRYFFLSIAVLVALALLDGLLFFPVVLSLVGPPALLTPRNAVARLPPPTPPQCALRSYSSTNGEDSKRHGSELRRHPHYKHGPTKPQSTAPRRPYHDQGLHGSNLSLTTITEEESTSNGSGAGSPRQSTHEILVEPQVVVETTTFGGPNVGQGIDYPHGDVPHHVTTTVTATAKVKVELHNNAVSGKSVSTGVFKGPRGGHIAGGPAPHRKDPHCSSGRNANINNSSSSSNSCNSSYSSSSSSSGSHRERESEGE